VGSAQADLLHCKHFAHLTTPHPGGLSDSEKCSLGVVSLEWPGPEPPPPLTPCPTPTVAAVAPSPTAERMVADGKMTEVARMKLGAAG